MSDIYKDLREEAYEANMEIRRRNLAIYTWGNASAFDSKALVFAIKPTGVPYEELKPQDMVIVDLEGKIVDGNLKPSSDTDTHRALYHEFVYHAFGSEAVMKGICHTHSPYAAAFAQARQGVPVLGTTHADYGCGEIPCSEIMSEEEAKGNYELETGKLIIKTFIKQNKNMFQMPMVLIAGHGPFTWGKDAGQAVYHAVILEEICKMAYLTLTLNPKANPLPDYLIKKHWDRKHGPNAYYGQKN
ncbi:MAG: L-ribulose-5-phosphate 4-epimerase AraD [Treponema sp.]|nr:L-ribulose-5-phosphate 4-epimerase AraD [Treponema sp.]